jgi:uncharacterized protein YodC (DUF2158 family)
MDFKKGDVVVLKSGSPKMTIDNIANYGIAGSEKIQAECVWFEGSKKQSNRFALESLEKFDD